jgi:hypothetical protein
MSSLSYFFVLLPPLFGAAWLSALPAAVFDALPVLPLFSTLLAAFAAFGPVCLCFGILVTSLRVGQAVSGARNSLNAFSSFIVAS